MSFSWKGAQQHADQERLDTVNTILAGSTVLTEARSEHRSDPRGGPARVLRRIGHKPNHFSTVQPLSRIQLSASGPRRFSISAMRITMRSTPVTTAPATIDGFAEPPLRQFRERHSARTRGSSHAQSANRTRSRNGDDTRASDSRIGYSAAATRRVTPTPRRPRSAARGPRGRRPVGSRKGPRYRACSSARGLAVRIRAPARVPSSRRPPW